MFGPKFREARTGCPEPQQYHALVVPASAIATRDALWPPNHRMEDIGIIGVTDPDGDPVSILITGITQDEPVNGLGDGDTAPDGAGVGTSTAQVRAERSGTGNGRVYAISFSATDGKGGKCGGQVTVCVPHDQGPHHACIDDAQRFDSTGGTRNRSHTGALSLGATPNPLNPSTMIHYALPEAEFVDLAIYDVAGRRVRTLVSGVQDAGEHGVLWDGRADAGRAMPSGVYISRLRAGRYEAIERLLMMK